WRCGDVVRRTGQNACEGFGEVSHQRLPPLIFSRATGTTEDEIRVSPPPSSGHAVPAPTPVPLPPNDGALAPGTRVGRYELVRRLAVGRMAELYLARQAG